MAQSQYSNITDELLSAYIDDAVTTSERALVEAAAASDQDVAWRLNSLRQTVALLGQLTDMPLPHSFTLNERLLADPAAASSVTRAATAHPKPESIWTRWQRFWSSGSPLYRNAAALCALLIVLILAGQSLTTVQSVQTVGDRSAPDSNEVNREMAQEDVSDQLLPVAPAAAPLPPSVAGQEQSTAASSQQPVDANAMAAEQAEGADSIAAEASSEEPPVPLAMSMAEAESDQQSAPADRPETAAAPSSRSDSPTLERASTLTTNSLTAPPEPPLDNASDSDAVTAVAAQLDSEESPAEELVVSSAMLSDEPTDEPTGEPTGDSSVAESRAALPLPADEHATSDEASEPLAQPETTIASTAPDETTASVNDAAVGEPPVEPDTVSEPEVFSAPELLSEPSVAAAPAEAPAPVAALPAAPEAAESSAASPMLAADGDQKPMAPAETTVPAQPASSMGPSMLLLVLVGCLFLFTILWARSRNKSAS